MWKWSYNFFYLLCDSVIEVPRDLDDVVSSSRVTTLLSLRAIDLMEVEIMTFIISVPISIPIPIPRIQSWGLKMATRSWFRNSREWWLFSEFGTKAFKIFVWRAYANIKQSHLKAKKQFFFEKRWLHFGMDVLL